MKFSWVLGLGTLFGWSQREEFFLGFNPRPGKWTNEFQRFKTANPVGVNWDIEPAAIQLMGDLVRTCQGNGIS